MKRTILLFMFCMALLTENMESRPEYQLLTGNNCVNCHISPNGGGPRNILGGYSRNETSIIENEAIIKFFEEINEKRAFADEKVIVGCDDRIQTARMGDLSNSQQKLFVMSVSPYATIIPAEWLKITGSYNLVYLPADLFKAKGSWAALQYQGQKKWTVSAFIQPTLDYPTLRIGYFSPSIGTRYDDHTMFIKTVWTTYPQTILPPDNSELAGELIYNYKNWAQVTGGIYGTKTLSELTVTNSIGESVPLAGPNKTAYLGKLVFTPRFFENKINTYFGGSYYYANDYTISSAFLGLGLTDKLTVSTEVTFTKKSQIRKTDNFLIEANYQLLNAFILFGRFESASTDDITNSSAIVNYKTYSYIIGASIYLIPNIEIRPEYRITDRRDFESYAAQWAIQLHLYY